MEQLSGTALLIVSVFGGIPMAGIISTFAALWTRKQAAEEIQGVLAIQLEAFRHRLLSEMDERHIGANGSRITGREIERTIEDIQESMKTLENRVLQLERRGNRPVQPRGAGAGD